MGSHYLRQRQGAILRTRCRMSHSCTLGSDARKGSARGASLKDPARLFKASLDGNVRRAIDIHEGEGKLVQVEFVRRSSNSQ